MGAARNSIQTTLICRGWLNFLHWSLREASFSHLNTSLLIYGRTSFYFLCIIMYEIAGGQIKADVFHYFQNIVSRLLLRVLIIALLA